ncbi:hypothetical protein BV20DRAFT_394676 [Pilatotrama ljubarskyi]|nr:hypothetical protein BV20DRAFT_394676 [Pilatotrama ljubarskyi]
MRVLSAFVTTTLFAGLAAALPAPESGSALLKRTEDKYSGDASQSVSSAYASSTGSSGYGSGYGSSSSSGYGSSSSSSGYGSSSSSSDCKDGKCDSSSSKSDCSNGKCDSSSSKSSSDCSSGNCDNSYSSSSSNYDSTSSAYIASSTEYMGSSSTSEYQSMSTAYESSSTEGYSSTSTASSSYATSTMSYGSGSTNWGGSGYNDCVQQCIASYGSPPSSWSPPTNTDSGDSSGSKGTGTTHTVIVAPTQGVLRYVPFAVNASVGDTVMFMWGANNHTVTKSSQLEMCNKTSDKPFASGEQNKPFTFTQVVNDTNPTFFYCGTPGHCQKGMFGMINPPSNFNAPTSVSQMMGGMVSNSSDMAAMMAYTNQMTQGNDKAANWGANIDMAQMPEWSHSLVLENVMYTRAFLGANKEVLQEDGSIDLNSHGAPLSLPTDMANVNNAVDNTSVSAQPNAAAAATPSAASSAAPAASSPAETGKSNGAASTAASSALLGVAAIAAAILAL